MINNKIPFGGLTENLKKKKKPLKLDTYLAIARTFLANDSTLCSFTGVSLTMLGIGLGIINLAHFTWMMVIGWLLVLLCPTIFLLGGWKHYRLRTNLGCLIKAAEENPEDPEASKALQQHLSEAIAD
jgi:hypothetical protein